MSKNWKAGYRTAMYRYVIEQGDDGFGAHSEREHLLTCLPNYAASRLEESSWDRYWDDSMQEGPPVMEHGVDAEITCACGAVEGLRLRVSASVGAILLDMLSGED